MGKKLITFSLWGDDDKYCIGACRNVILAQRLYPDWTCRFYVDRETVPIQHLLMLSQTGNTELVEMPENMKGWMGMFARFLPANEDDVDVFISRDCDSRIGEREVAAVNAWLEGPKLIHVMRDHPHHTTPILGGMWGAKRGALPDLKDQIEAYVGPDGDGDFWQVDQNLLREIVWPANYHKVLAHDDWRRFTQAETRPFPTPRDEALSFVGEILDENSERVHPEHTDMLR